MPELIDLAVNIIKKFEGLRLKAYKPIPSDPWTIGYGQTGPTINKNTVWTKEQAEYFLNLEANELYRKLRKGLNVNLNYKQWAAILSLVYNIGINAFAHSTLLRKLNDKDPTASAEFDRWVYGGGTKLNGLVKRRAEERKLFES